MNDPKTLEEARAKRYNQWGGNKKGTAYDPEYCAYEVWGDFLSHQCLRKNGHGDEGLYCKQHARILAR